MLHFRYAIKSNKKMSGQPSFRLHARLPPPVSSPDSSARTTMSSLTLRTDESTPGAPPSASSSAAVNLMGSQQHFGSPTRSGGANLIEALDDDFHWQKGALSCPCLLSFQTAPFLCVCCGVIIRLL